MRMTTDQATTLAIMDAGAEAGVYVAHECHQQRLTELGRKGMLEYDRDLSRWIVTLAGHEQCDPGRVATHARRFARRSYNRVERLRRELVAAEAVEIRWRHATAPEPCDMCGAAQCSDEADCDLRRLQRRPQLQVPRLQDVPQQGGGLRWRLACGT